jgi:hypothetical protein
VRCGRSSHSILNEQQQRCQVGPKDTTWLTDNTPPNGGKRLTCPHRPLDFHPPGVASGRCSLTRPPATIVRSRAFSLFLLRKDIRRGQPPAAWYIIRQPLWFVVPETKVTWLEMRKKGPQRVERMR